MPKSGNWVDGARIASDIVLRRRWDKARAKFACWGDSLTNSYTSYLAAAFDPPRAAYNGGVGGEPIASIQARVAADTLYGGRVHILWDRQNTGSGTNAQWISDMIATVALFPSRKYIVISDINKTDGTEDVGSDWRTNQTIRNAGIAAAFGDHYLDVVDILDNDSLRSDHLHLTAAANSNILVPAIQQKLYDLGYTDQAPVGSAFRGFNRDFYEYESDNVTPTNHWTAFQDLVANGFRGGTVNACRINQPSSDEYGHGWFESAISDLCDLLGDDGFLICVVADQTYLNTFADAGASVYATADSIMTAHAAATGKPTVIFQVGNEPYIGAEGTHAELDQNYADNAIAVSVQLKTDHPTVKTCIPPLGTFFTADPEGDLDTNWTQMLTVFAGHGTFDYAAANCYPVSGSNSIVTYASLALQAAASTLGVDPIITEIGVENGTSEEIGQVLAAAGGNVPAVVWRIGPGDDYDLIASGAVEVPVTI